jgi:hypothetical protein
MIAFAAAISDPEPYRRFAEPGIRLAADPDSEVLAFGAVGSIGRSYNMLLDAAAAHDDLEALVLVHPYMEIADPNLCAKVRTAFADPDVAVLGCMGASGVRSIAWWEGSVVSAPVTHRYHEHGGGDRPAFSWVHAEPPPTEVDTVDGLLLVLSAWAVRNVRFDESLHLGHGYDLDYCLQVREAGRKVVAVDIRAIQHRSLDLVKDLDLWIEAHVAMSRKWNGRIAGVDTDDASWKARARRAEAEREAARAFAFSSALKLDARVLELERAFEQATSTLSWRITAPLRRLNRLRSARASRTARDGSSREK